MAYESYNRRSNDDERERLRNNSMSGETGKRTREKMIRISLSSYKKRLQALAIGVCAVTTVAVSCVPGAVNAVSNNWTINKLSNSFHTECVLPETHRTDNKEHFFYDYSDIAKHLEEYGDFDEAVFLLNRNIGYYQTGQVLRWTPYESFTNYLEVKGYDGEEDFQDSMKEQIIKGIEIEKLQSELDEMQAEHTSSLDQEVENSMGGK